jgi:4-amino-4-deoxy-L-arabinose transferase-like glycosyltransferase
MTSPYRWLTAALFAALTIPRLAQLGMFFDGVRDASIARNMAEGVGSFWAPSYTQTIYPRFFDTPPLGLGLQSLAFRAAGDHPAVERVFAVSCGAATALLVALVWRRTVGDPRADWLPVILWLVPASVTWAIVNNMMETTQALFATAAVLAAIVAVTASPALLAAAGAVAGVLVAAALLVDGPVGVFPLAAPALLAAVIRRDLMRRAAAVTAIMAGVLLVVALVLVWNRPSREALEAYLQSRVSASPSGARQAAQSVLAFMSILAGGVLLRLAAVLAALWLAAGRPRPALRDPWMWFFGTLGLCASLPVAIGPAPMGHDFVPAVPFFALAGAVPAWRWIAGRLGQRAAPRVSTAAGVMALILIGLTVAIPVAHGAVEARDVGLLRALQSLGPALPRGGVVATCPALAADWPIHAYLQRLYRVSLDAAGPRPLYLRAVDAGCPVPEGCLLIRFTAGLELYSCDGAAITER